MCQIKNVLIDKDKTIIVEKILIILSSFDYDFSVVERQITQTSRQNLDIYENILKRKNSNYHFREIKFYKNPGFSLEVVDVNQGIIIDSIVNNVLQAKRNQPYNDIFVTAPTGSGKSVLFQIPAIYLSENKGLFTIIVTPLIGLMNDQVNNIQSMTKNAAIINSDYTPQEKEIIKEKIRTNIVSILYVSPETLLSNTDISTLIGDREIGLIVIDESHIVSTWGKSFRPDYWFLGDYISYLRTKKGYKFPIATFSATVTYGGNDDMHGDIMDSLKMRTGNYEYIAPMRRDDISFDISIHEKINDYKKEKDDIVFRSLSQLINDNKKTISYFPFVSHVKDFNSKLMIDFKSKFGLYFGNLDKSYKNETMSKFVSNDYALVLATKAFGMGIDVDDVEVVYHYAPTGNLCDYVQEIGRAARNESLHGVAKLDYFENDFRYIKQLYGMSSINDYHIIAVLRKLKKIYEIKNKRNFTVSSDDFSYIFPMSMYRDDVDTKLKTVLLMIQKDFEKNPRINFKPLVFKPRTMFTKGYLMIKKKAIAN